MNRFRHLPPPVQRVLSLWGLVLALAGGLQAADPVSRATRQGRALYEQGRYQEALDAFGQGRLADPESPALAFGTGATLIRLNRPAEARWELERALTAVDPVRRPRVLYNLGTAALAEGDWPAAVAYLRESLRLDPAQPDAKHNLELALRREEPPAGGESGPNGGEPSDSDSGSEATSDPPSPGNGQARPDSTAGQPPAGPGRSDPGAGDDQTSDPADAVPPAPEELASSGPPGADPAADPPRGNGADSAGPPGGDPLAPAGRLSPEQARQLLRALQAREGDELRRGNRTRSAPRGRGDRDW